MATRVNGVSVISQGVRLPLSKERIKKLAGKVLHFLKEKDSVVCLFFVNDAAMRRMNLKYKKIDKPTDCLAFPMREGADNRIHREILGDIVISVDTAKKNSKYFDSTVQKELSLYVIHGILHLLGYDDTTISSRNKMRKIEESILKRFGGFYQSEKARPH